MVYGKVIRGLVVIQKLKLRFSLGKDVAVCSLTERLIVSVLESLHLDCKGILLHSVFLDVLNPSPDLYFIIKFNLCGIQNIQLKLIFIKTCNEQAHTNCSNGKGLGQPGEDK